MSQNLLNPSGFSLLRNCYFPNLSEELLCLLLGHNKVYSKEVEKEQLLGRLWLLVGFGAGRGGGRPLNEPDFELLTSSSDVSKNHITNQQKLSLIGSFCLTGQIFHRQI